MDASTVQIRIDVLDVNSGPVVQKVTQNLQQLGNAGATSGGQIGTAANSFRFMAQSGTIAGQVVKQSMQEAGDGALTNLQKTHLLTEEFGIRLPRAFMHLIAESKTAQAALSAVGTGLVALGAVQIGVLIFDQIYQGLSKLWDEHLSLTKAAQDYRAEVEKTRQEEFGNTRSIETTTERIKEATAALDGYKKAADDALKPGVENGLKTATDHRQLLNFVVPGAGTVWHAYNQRSEAHDALDKQYQQQRMLDKLNQGADTQQYHQQRMTDIEWEHAGDGRLRGQQKINAELKKTIQLDAEDRRFANEQDRALGNPVPVNAGLKEETDKNQMAKRKADAETFNLQREQGQELARIREEALEAGLRGVDLYKAKEAFAIEELKFKDMDSVAARAAVHAKFHAEELRRLEDEGRETDKIMRAASTAGLAGVPKIQAEGAARVGDINADDNLNPINKIKRIAASNFQMHAEIVEAEQEFTNRVNQLADESATHQISGFARIRADATKQIDQLLVEYQRLYGKDTSAPEYKAHAGELNRGTGLINNLADQQASDLTRKNADETAQIEAEARAKSMNAEKQQSKAIEAEYEERLRKYQEQLKQQEISDDDYNRRIAAAAEMRDAEMVESARAAREKMAGEFSSLFKSLDHPVQALKDIGDKAAGMAAAALVQRAQNHFGGAGASTAPITQQSLMERLFTPLAGKPRGTGDADVTAAASSATKVTNVTDVTNVPRGTSPGSGPFPHQVGGAEAAHKMIALTSADIHVTNATIALGSMPSTAATPGTPGAAGAAGAPGAPGAAGNAGAATVSTTGFESLQPSPGSSTAAPPAPGAPGAAGAIGAPGAPGSIYAPEQHELRAAQGFSSPPGVPGNAGASTVSALPSWQPGAPSSTTSLSVLPGSVASPPTTEAGIAATRAAGNAAAQYATSGSTGRQAAFSGTGATQPTQYAASSATSPGAADNGPLPAGGAGDVGYAARGPVGFTGSPGTAPAKSNVFGSVMGDLNSGISLVKQGAKIFSGGASSDGSGGNAGASTAASSAASSVDDSSGLAETQGDIIPGQFNADGTFGSSTASQATNGGMLGGGGIGANMGGAIGGALGLFGAFEGNGGIGGALQGAASGMELGMSLGGPIGAMIGAAGGAVLGAIGFGGKEKARVYDLKQVRPRLSNDTDAFEQGSMDYTSAYTDMQSIYNEAWKAMKQMGPAAESYFNDTVKKEIAQAQQKLTSEQRAGRSDYTATAAQYDWGGPVDNFGSHSDGPDHGMIRAQRGEFVVEQQAAGTHAEALNAINSGATHADMAKHYGAEPQTMPAAQAPAWSGDVHIHAIDSKSVQQLLMGQKHTLRAAINESYAENSGSSDAS
jgi:hypothetical protein